MTIVLRTLLYVLVPIFGTTGRNFCFTLPPDSWPQASHQSFLILDFLLLKGLGSCSWTLCFAICVVQNLPSLLPQSSCYSNMKPHHKVPNGKIVLPLEFTRVFKHSSGITVRVVRKPLNWVQVFVQINISPHRQNVILHSPLRF